MSDAPPLDVQVQETDGQRVLDASGEINLHTSPTFAEHLSEALDGAGALKVRLADVSFIDSSGVAALVRTYKRAQERGVEMALLEPSEAVMSVLQLTYLTSLFPIEKGEA